MCPILHRGTFERAPCAKSLWTPVDAAPGGSMAPFHTASFHSWGRAAVACTFCAQEGATMSGYSFITPQMVMLRILSVMKTRG